MNIEQPQTTYLHHGAGSQIYIDVNDPLGTEWVMGWNVASQKYQRYENLANKQFYILAYSSLFRYGTLPRPTNDDDVTKELTVVLNSRGSILPTFIQWVTGSGGIREGFSNNLVFILIEERYSTYSKMIHMLIIHSESIGTIRSL